jgi:hypothetical protein
VIVRQAFEERKGGKRGKWTSKVNKIKLEGLYRRFGSEFTPVSTAQSLRIR